MTLLERVLGVGLLIAGGPLTFFGLVWPCNLSLTTEGSVLVPSCGETYTLAACGMFLIASGALVLAAAVRMEHSPRGRRRLAVILCVSAVVLFATIATLAVVPVHLSFTIRNAAVYDAETECLGIYTVQGTTISFSWWANSSITFGAWSCSEDHIVYEANGTGGAEEFVSVGGVYSFGAICGGSPSCVAADVSGTYTAPFLQL